METSTQISFTVRNYKYTVTHIIEDDTIFLECIETNKFFRSSLTISDPIISSDTNDGFKLSFTPKILYKLFEEYANGTLDEMYKFVFYNCCTKYLIETKIELITKMPYDDNTDHKFLILKEVVTTDAQRFDDKFEQFKKDIMTNYVSKKELVDTLKLLEKNLIKNSISNNENVSNTKCIDEKPVDQIQKYKLISGSDDGTIKIWDWDSTKVLAGSTPFWQGVNRPVCDVILSPNKKLIASLHSNRIIKIWDANTLELIIEKVHHSDNVDAIAFSLDSKFIASCNDNTITIWDVTTFSLSQTLVGHTDRARCIVFSHDGEFIVSGSNDYKIKIWNVKTGNLVRTLDSHNATVRCIAISHDGAYLASGSFDDTINIWNYHTGALIRTLSGHKNSVMAVVFSRNDNYIVSGSADSTVRIWDYKSGKLMNTLEEHNRGVYGLAISPDNNIFVSGSNDNTIKIWDYATMTVVRTLTGHKDCVNSITFMN